MYESVIEVMKAWPDWMKVCVWSGVGFVLLSAAANLSEYLNRDKGSEDDAAQD